VSIGTESENHRFIEDLDPVPEAAPLLTSSAGIIPDGALLGRGNRRVVSFQKGFSSFILPVQGWLG